MYKNDQPIERMRYTSQINHFELIRQLKIYTILTLKKLWERGRITNNSGTSIKLLVNQSDLAAFMLKFYVYHNSKN